MTPKFKKLFFDFAKVVGNLKYCQQNLVKQIKNLINFPQSLKLLMKLEEPAPAVGPFVSFVCFHVDDLLLRFLQLKHEKRLKI